MEKSIMAIYLVDYENTQNLLGINNLFENDYVVIFYSQKASSLSFEAHKEIYLQKQLLNINMLMLAVKMPLTFN